MEIYRGFFASSRLRRSLVFNAGPDLAGIRVDFQDQRSLIPVPLLIRSLQQRLPLFPAQDVEFSHAFFPAACTWLLLATHLGSATAQYQGKRRRAKKGGRVDSVIWNPACLSMFSKQFTV